MNLTPIYGAVVALAGATGAAFAVDVQDLPMRTLNGLEGPSKGQNISNTPIANASLGDEGLSQLVGYNLRTRSWLIGADAGVVPIHSHRDRPAIVYTLTGEIYEYRSDADARILHSAGGLSLEEGSVTHWWLNEGPAEVRLIAFDVFKAGSEDADSGGVVTPVAFDLPEQTNAELQLLGFVDIEAHYDGAKGAGLALSAYRARIAPGGTLPSFVDAGEPLQVWVHTGEVLEYRSDADTAVVRTANEGAYLRGGVQAYWQNRGDTVAEVFFGVVEPLTEVAGVQTHGIMAHSAQE